MAWFTRDGRGLGADRDGRDRGHRVHHGVGKDHRREARRARGAGSPWRSRGSRGSRRARCRPRGRGRARPRPPHRASRAGRPPGRAGRCARAAGPRRDRRSDASVASSTSAARRLDIVAASNARTGPIAERPRASAPASASRPPAVAALTVPIPVMTTRRSVTGSGLLEDEADVLAAEAERVRQRGAHLGGARGERHAVEGDLGIRPARGSRSAAAARAGAPGSWRPPRRCPPPPSCGRPATWSS